jgi:hypothetical protein
MDNTILIRETDWLWLRYLFWVIVFGYCVFFFIRTVQAIRTAMSRRELVKLASEGGKESEMNVSVAFSLVLQASMFILGIYCLTIMYRDSFGGFTAIRVGENHFTLCYTWPRPTREFPIANVKSVRTRRWGKSSEVLEFSTTEEKGIRSVSEDPDIIESARKDLERTIKEK